MSNGHDTNFESDGQRLQQQNNRDKKKSYRQVTSTEKKNEPQLFRTFPASLFLRVLSGYEANGIDIALALNSRNTFPMTVLDLA